MKFDQNKMKDKFIELTERLNINLKFKGIEMLKEKFLKPENIFSIK